MTSNGSVNVYSVLFPLFVCGGVLGSCFVRKYFVSFLVSAGEERLVVSRLLSSGCHGAVIVLCIFLVVPLAGLWRMIVAFSGHIHLLFISYSSCDSLQVSLLQCYFLPLCVCLCVYVKACVCACVHT